MRKNIKYFIGIILVFSFVMGFTTPMYASNIKDAESEVDNLEQKKKDLQENIEDLEKDKGNITNYIEKLDKQLNSLTKDITDTNSDIKETTATLLATREELELAKVTEENQYKSMKARIKYMYENGSGDYVEVLLRAESISDLLNRSEYIEKVSEYDKDMLTRYQATKIGIEEKETQISAKLKELETLNAELELEQGSVNTLIDNKSKELKKYESEIVTSKDQMDQYEAEILKQEDVIEDLLEKERQRIEAEKKAEEAKKKAEEEQKKLQEQQEKQEQSGTTDTEKDSTEEEDTSEDSGNVSGSFRWPLRIAGTITSTFGTRSRPTAGASTNHQGVDIAASVGTPIVASAAGTVVTASYQSAAGNYVMIYHGNSTYTVYMHASSLNVSVGQKVNQGAVIAYVGSTGASTGPHLHFGLSKNGSYVNPLNYVSR